MEAITLRTVHTVIFGESLQPWLVSVEETELAKIKDESQEVEVQVEEQHHIEYVKCHEFLFGCTLFRFRHFSQLIFLLAFLLHLILSSCHGGRWKEATYFCGAQVG